MARFQLLKGTAKGKSWKAVGTHPQTGRSVTLQGGQKGVEVGKKNGKNVAAFTARQEARGITPKIYVNALRWNNEIDFNDWFDIPDELFGKAER